MNPRRFFVASVLLLSFLAKPVMAQHELVVVIASGVGISYGGTLGECTANPATGPVTIDCAGLYVTFDSRSSTNTYRLQTMVGASPESWEGLSMTPLLLTDDDLTNDSGPSGYSKGTVNTSIEPLTANGNRVVVNNIHQALARANITYRFAVHEYAPAGTRTFTVAFTLIP